MSKTRETVQLSGPLTIKTIAAAKELLQTGLTDAKAAGRMLTIEIDGGNEFDLTLPQLLLSACQTAKEMGVEITLNGPAEGNFRTVIERAGLLTGDKSKDSFWLEGQAA